MPGYPRRFPAPSFIRIASARAVRTWPAIASSVLSSKVKLGADATAAAGPKGRSASAATDAAMRAEMLSYSRARGLFAGHVFAPGDAR